MYKAGLNSPAFFCFNFLTIFTRNFNLLIISTEELAAKIEYLESALKLALKNKSDKDFKIVQNLYSVMKEIICVENFDYFCQPEYEINLEGKDNNVYLVVTREFNKEKKRAIFK